MSAPLEAVLLDMGGVLVDTKNGTGLPRGQLDFRGREALLHALRDGGGRASERDLEELVFRPWRREYERRYDSGREAAWEPHLERLAAASGSSTTPEALLVAWFRPYAETLEPMAGGLEVLDALRGRGLRLALVSNVAVPGELYRRRLVAWGHAERFEALFFSYDHGHRKPSPVMLADALGRLETVPTRAIMVGDRRDADVAAGIAAGMRTVWLASAHDRGPRPDAEISSLAELPGLLARWSKG